jgi:hypothetical protein
MSKSTPGDVAVAFRSLARRQREAAEAAEGAPLGDLDAALGRAVGEAATLVGSARDAAAVADAIDARPAVEWDAAVLDRLRALAVEAGTVVRDMAARGPSDHG